MFNSGGFELRKWISNSADLLRDVPDEHREQSSLSSIEGDPLFRTLGLTWNIKEDCFCYTYSPYREPQTITKRVVLARVAQLFDPLGWITPIITRGKLLVQQLWRVKLEWDEEIPLDLLNQWREFNDQLNHLSSITIPRWLNLESSTSSIQIHGFGDASDAAVGVYTEVRTLSGGIIGEVGQDVQESLSLTSVETHLWTDSSITFYWIKGDASRWKAFIQNRVVLIQSTIPNAIWHHVPGEENPADVASRGVSSEQLTSDRLWWEGPHWICEDQSTWPVLGEIEIDTELVEERQIKIHTVRASEEEFLTKFSTLTKAVSSASWWRRFYQSLAKKNTINKTSWLTVDERRHALWGLISFTQQQQFHQEITTLSKGEPISRSSTLIQLNPYIDKDGLLRVSSRLENSSLQAEAVNPIILPKESRLTELILHDCHVNTHHGGAQLTSMLATLRQNYWIVGGRVPVRSFINKCVTCVRHRAKQSQQLMGQLPPSRVLKMRPFLHTGVDYAGPFELKTWSGRGNKKYKAYLVVFVCMSSSAVHLELATDYTTEDFLAAFERFISRRGSCTKLYSDCGTNFVGADAELKKLFTASSKGVKELASLLARDGTSWSFIPPGSPHFGGKWESVVKSSKHHIKRVIGDHVLTYEQFTTFLTQVECLLNSRPLCPLSDDPEDLQALTPGHFLIGEPLNLVSEPLVLEVPDNRLTS
ncbi:uncharacterized protein LOC122852307 [Aphidius gifuensis]|uniref:uncharacterized protein LOC122852307 n=1 Tax=Aphidius gifuensis TaxID=684658 RepID=UPI001CDBD440|nr:uncharacterized protein LOC122852307 [Aphidius gifuensis]